MPKPVSGHLHPVSRCKILLENPAASVKHLPIRRFNNRVRQFLINAHIGSGADLAEANVYGIFLPTDTQSNHDPSQMDPLHRMRGTLLQCGDRLPSTYPVILFTKQFFRSKYSFICKRGVAISANATQMRQIPSPNTLNFFSFLSEQMPCVLFIIDADTRIFIRNV